MHEWVSLLSRPLKMKMAIIWGILHGTDKAVEKFLYASVVSFFYEKNQVFDRISKNKL